MNRVTGRQLADQVDTLVHKPTQVQDESIHLTVASLERFSGTPAFDFGGDEYSASRTELIEPEKRNSDDDYGWWELDSGTYLVELNEAIRLDDGMTGVVQPWWKLLGNGIRHQTQVITGDHPDFHVLLSVGSQGVSIKENARVSELQVYR